MATRDSTKNFRDRLGEEFGRAFYRRFNGRVVSSIGIGTYLGDPTDAVDDLYHDAIVMAVEGGMNVVDTAVNYRHQRSERVIARALSNAAVDREAVVLATKGGFIPFDETKPRDPRSFVQTEYVQQGLVDPSDIARGIHSIAPGFIDRMVDRSLGNLEVETIDLYYLHNPEMQLLNRSAEAVYDQVEAAFEILETRIAEGDIRSYGVATWEAFRVSADHDQYLSLAEITERARTAAAARGRDATGFRAIQLPFNVGMADAYTVASHNGASGRQSALSIAADAGLSVVTSASLAQGQLTQPGAIPPSVADRLPGETPAHRAINFARSAPGVTTSLVGMKSPKHVEENLAAGRFAAMGAREFDATFTK